MANSIVAEIESKVNAWLDKHDDKLELDLTSIPIQFKAPESIAPNAYTGVTNLYFLSNETIQSALGFKDSNISPNSSLEDFRSSFDYITLDKLPLPGLEGIPIEWTIRPQTPRSSISDDDVTFESYDPSTQILRIHIQTKFFAVYGATPEASRYADAPSPEGTYFQVRRDFQGDIRIAAKLIFP